MSLIYTDASSNYWEISDYGYLGTMYSSGKYDSYDSYNASLSILVNSSTAYLSYSTPTTTANSQTVVGTDSYNKISATRDTYIGNGFARYLESFTNKDTVAKTITITISDDLYNYSNNQVSASSSGDTTYSTSDKWVAINNSYYTNTTNALHIFSGGSLLPTATSFSGDSLTTTFTFTLAAGETKSFMHFYAPVTDSSSATTLGDSISNLSNSSYLTGLSSSQKSTIQNFVFNKTSATTATLANYEVDLTLTGTSAIDGTGNSKDNKIIGNSASNKLYGLAGDDILDGGTGNDTMVGGIGNDIYYVDSIPDIVTEDANSGVDTVNSTVSYDISTKAYIENITLIGTASINATGNSVSNILVGNSAANILTGGLGNDTYVIGAGDTVVELANGGTDTVQSSITYTLGSNVENLTLTGTTNINGMGNSVSNTIIGNSGDNILDGKGGIDSLQGGVGNDTYIFNTGTTIVETADAGIDTVQSSINYTLGSNVENLILTGNVATTGIGNTLDNTIIGNGLNNTLNGQDGNDTLRGLGGNDTLNGGNGNDILIGDNGYAEGQIASATATINNQKVSLNISIPESATGSLSVTGNISTADFSNKLNIVYILDRSGSMSSSFLGTTNVGDLNGDNSTNTVLDAAIASFIKLNDTIVSSGMGNNINIALVPFESSSVLQYNASAWKDSNGNKINDLTESLQTLTLGGGTDYTAALTTAKDYLSSLNNGGKNIVFFASDGAPNDTSYLSTLLPSLRTLGGGTTIKAIGLGTGADEEVLDILDDNISNNSAQIVLNPEELDTTLLDSSILGLAEGAWIEIYKNNVLVDLIGSDRFEITPLGVQFKSESFALSSTGSDNITAKLVMADNNATMLSTSAPVSIKTFVSDDTLNGGVGNDILDGGFGADNMYGGSDNDTYYVDNIGDKVYETTTATSGLDSGGKDLVNSSISYTLGDFVEDLTLTGTKNLNGTGNTLDNTVIGNTGDNIINGGTGNDTMIGGAGNDTYYIDSTSDIITEKLNEGIDTVITTLNTTLYGDSSYSTSSYYSYYYGSQLYNIENVTLATDATGNTLTGSDKDNVLKGNSAANTLNGGIGNDTMIGGAGNDTMVGGAGNDIYVIDTTLDIITENLNEGIDTVQSVITYTLGTNLENLTLTGTANINGTGNTLNNIITGNTGNNVINGGTGDDTMKGADGNDTYYVNSFLDKVIEKVNEGTDTVSSSIGYKLSSNVENLILSGTTNIAGSGNELANKITGNSGSNYLFGYSGDDVLYGKLGNDTLTGGLGKDIFVFDTAINSTTNVDKITDFSVTDDTIHLSKTIFTSFSTTGTLLNTANFVSNIDGLAKDANDYLVYETDSGKLFYDADGSGSGISVQIALIENKAALTYADFTII